MHARGGRQLGPRWRVHVRLDALNSAWQATGVLPALHHASMLLECALKGLHYYYQ